MLLLGAFAAVAVLLAAVGIAGVVANGVALAGSDYKARSGVLRF